ncbi:MAG: FAD binding domain-containing protein [Synergistaceae bacterium]|nr:FAD binding domain-containing protein [Synergistaceae bacterium]
MTILIRPESIDDLLADINEYRASERHLLAGGTDWLIRNRRSLPESSVVFDMSRLKELRGIRLTGSGLLVGAMETMSSIHTNGLVRQYGAALSDAASVMGSVQIRNRATVGGNLANASPAADTPCALAALDASVMIVSPKAARTIRVENVLSASPNVNTLSDDEVVTGFNIPLRKGYISAFKKIGSRSEVSIARINMAVSLCCRDGLFSDVRVYVGTLGTAAKRCRDAEKALAQPGTDRMANFKEALAGFAEQMIPGRSTLPYKKSAIQGLGEDILAMLAVRGKAAEQYGE